jgi:phosphoglycolate phosphatase-like HAD superfamily hydrolase
MPSQTNEIAIKKEKMWRSMMKVLFIDLDGTLTDILEREVEAIYDTAHHFGALVSKAEIRRLCLESPSYSNVFRDLRLELTDELVDYWSAAFVKRYRLSILREGTESTLDALSQEYTLFCVTSRESSAEVISELDFLGLASLFRQVVTRETAAAHFGLLSLPLLPFPEQRKKLYECALALANCNSEDAVVVGDMDSELKPAKELGVLTVGLVTEKVKERGLREVADYLIPNMEHLQNILHELPE